MRVYRSIHARTVLYHRSIMERLFFLSVNIFLNTYHLDLSRFNFVNRARFCAEFSLDENKGENSIYRALTHTRPILYSDVL